MVRSVAWPAQFLSNLNTSIVKHRTYSTLVEIYSDTSQQKKKKEKKHKEWSEKEKAIIDKNGGFRKRAAVSAFYSSLPYPANNTA